MTENAKRIWGLLKNAGMTDAAAAAMLGNMQAESALRPNNAQDNMSHLTDDEYTRFVDLGTYANFATDAVGYGLCQWTYKTRKRALLTYARAEGASIGYLAMQVNFCIKELKEDYGGLWKYLCSTTDIYTATERICREYERPAVNNIGERLGYARKWFEALREGQAAADPAEPRKDSEYWPPRTVALGMIGPDVTVWQALLNARGYECPIGNVFDSGTESATKSFQSDAGLTPDGIPGPISWAAALSTEKGG